MVNCLCMRQDAAYSIAFNLKLIILLERTKKYLLECVSHGKSCVFTVYSKRPHVTPDSFIPHSFSVKLIPAREWKHCLQSNLSQIHSYHGGKDQTRKEIATCQNIVSPRICCEQAVAGMLRAFPVHFVVLQSNSTQCNMYGSRAATENWMKCNISLKHSFGQIFVNWHISSRSTWNLCTPLHQNTAH